MPTINLAEKYSGKIDQGFTHDSFTERWTNTEYDFDGVKTIKVYTLTSQPLSDYDRASTGDRYGGNPEMEDTIATYTLENDKSFKLAIDKGNEKQSVTARNAGKALKVEIREQVTPTFDKNVFAKVAAAGDADAITISTGAYDAIMDANVALDEANVPLDGRVLFVTSAVYKDIKKDITTTINADTYNSKLVGKGYVGELDGVPVVKVPSSYFPEGVGALLWHKSVVLGAKQLAEARVRTDNEMLSGSLLMGRYIFDAFVLEAKAKGVAVVKTA